MLIVKMKEMGWARIEGLKGKQWFKNHNHQKKFEGKIV
jgi:hypothetical protein